MMKFETQLKRVEDAGFKTFESLHYFFYFAKNEGKAVRELTGDNIDEYQRALRFFKLLSDGTKREPGMGLMVTEETHRKWQHEGRSPKVRAIKLTPKGQKLLSVLKPKIKRTMSKSKSK